MLGPSSGCGKIEYKSLGEFYKNKLNICPKLINCTVLTKTEKIQWAYLSDGESTGLPLSIYRLNNITDLDRLET